MLYTVIIKKKAIVDASSPEDARDALEADDVIIYDEEISRIRETTKSEKINYSLK